MPQAPEAIFSRATFEFLEELAAHNDRTWFEAHKARYELSVREPARAFIRAMAGPLARVSRHFTADDRKVGGSLMRVHRDTRFGNDKRPYKTNVGIQFRHAAGKDVHAPGFYVHLAPDECFVGVGLWRPEPDALDRIRARIAAEPKTWTKIIGAASFKAHLEQGGESLKRPPRGVAPDHPLVDELRRKDFIAAAPLTRTDALSPRFVETVAARFADGRAYVKFLCGAIDVPF